MAINISSLSYSASIPAPIGKAIAQMLHRIIAVRRRVQETFGAELVSRLNRQHIDRVIRKGMDWMVDSYSGFYDNGHLRSTGLAEYLKEERIQNVAVIGLATDY